MYIYILSFSFLGSSSLCRTGISSYSQHSQRTRMSSTKPRPSRASVLHSEQTLLLFSLLRVLISYHNLYHYHYY